MLEPGEMSMPELVEALHRIADEIESRMMQAAGKGEEIESD